MDDVKDEAHKCYIEWLRREVMDHCNEGGRYETYWDYDDEVTSAQVIEARDKWRSEGFASPAARLETAICEGQSPYLESELLDQIRRDAGDEMREMLDSSTDVWGDLEEAGYNGVDVMLDDLLGQSSFRVNLGFATPAERNLDMGSIVSSFGNDYRTPGPADVGPECLDNALSWLLNQQGHGVAELYEALDGGESPSKLISSVVEEISENPSEAMSELTALVRMDGRRLLDLIGRLEKPRGSITLPARDSTIGIFNGWGGCGGLLGIELERDATIPLSMVSRYSIEGQPEGWPGHTVDSVYGLDWDMWRGGFEIGPEEPDDPCEDYGRALSLARMAREPHGAERDYEEGLER